jgi:hypothetical protein
MVTIPWAVQTCVGIPWLDCGTLRAMETPCISTTSKPISASQLPLRRHKANKEELPITIGRQYSESMRDQIAQDQFGGMSRVR